MAKINLLPWRVERRRQRDREFYTMLVAATGAAVLACFGAYSYLDACVNAQDARNSYLRGEVKQLESKLAEIKGLEATKASLLARQQVIEKLQSGRTQMVHLFDELVRTIPDGVRLTSLQENGTRLTLQGVAQANGNVTNYMRNLDKSAWMEKAELKKTEVKGNDKRTPYEFSLTVDLRSTEREAVAAPSAGAPAQPGAAPVPAAGNKPAPAPPADGKGAP